MGRKRYCDTWTACLVILSQCKISQCLNVPAALRGLEILLSTACIARIGRSRQERRGSRLKDSGFDAEDSLATIDNRTEPCDLMGSNSASYMVYEVHQVYSVHLDTVYFLWAIDWKNTASCPRMSPLRLSNLPSHPQTNMTFSVFGSIVAISRLTNSPSFVANMSRHITSLEIRDCYPSWMVDMQWLFHYIEALYSSKLKALHLTRGYLSRSHERQWTARCVVPRRICHD
ncbi:hypothetical protein An03g06200 [Aspergillus niger]|uniref:Uncharacterized protein n=2 Tax=Aspergillus niger TaxID=5061 RepID=A2QHA6_ASPNC|nr:hypothetical protein An03g06200 [Aspergillus niger]CAK38376.1 hypothetical protein An03g06200 [Aspergillus niger]